MTMPETVAPNTFRITYFFRSLLRGESHQTKKSQTRNEYRHTSKNAKELCKAVIVLYLQVKGFIHKSIMENICRKKCIVFCL